MERKNLVRFLMLCALTGLAACAPVAKSPPLTSTEVLTQPTETPRPELAKTPESISALSTTAEDETVCFTATEMIPFAFTPDSRTLLLRGSADVQLIDLDSMQEDSYLHAAKNIVATTLSPNGEVLAWSLEDNTIQLVRVADQEILHTLAGHKGLVTKLKFTPAGDELISAGQDGWVRIWSLLGEELRSFQPPGEVLGIGISADGATTLATVPFDGPVALWKLDTLEKIKDLAGTGGFDTSDAEFSLDGTYLAADLATGLYLWRVADGEPVWDHAINSMAVAFSPDGRYLAYADIDKNNDIFVRKADGSEIILTLAGHQAPVWGLFFSPDSLLLHSNDGVEVRVWQVEDGSLRYTGKQACP